MNMTLYEISNTYREAAEKLVDMELPPEAIKDTLDGLGGELQVKATNVAMCVKNLEGLAAQIKEAESQMAHRRNVLENRAESIREYIKTCMESAGITEISCPYFTLKPKKNPPAVEILDEQLIPKDFMKQPEPPPPSPDKKALLEHMKAGNSVDGARLIQRTRLDIR